MDTHSHFLPSSDLTAHLPSRLHPFHLNLTQDILHYPTHPKANLSPRSPPDNHSMSWPLPPHHDPRIDPHRPWAKPTTLTPAVFLPANAVGSHNYHSFLLMESMECSANFSSDAEPV